MVRIRLSRMGRRHRPFYRINAIEKQRQRDGKVLENLGWYDPVAQDESKRLSLKEDRIKDWISRGAVPSDTVMMILGKNEVIDISEWQAQRERHLARKKKRIAEEKNAAAEAEKVAAAEKAAAEKAAAEKAAAEAAAKAKAEAEAAAKTEEAPAEGAESTENA